MTGYGRSQQIIDNFEITVEIKSVNHRYTDFNFRISRNYAFLEEPVKAFLKGYVSRGKVDVHISVQKQMDDSKEVSLNIALAKHYIDALKALGEHFGIENDIKTSTMARFGDIFEVSRKQDDEEEIIKLVLTVCKEAADNFIQMRLREGEKLAADMLMRARLIGRELDKIDEIAPSTVVEHRQKIEQRIKELLGEVPVDENRLLMETAILADKLSITEEIIRLRSHLDEFEHILNQDEAVGRKLDFLLQEMNREINTIGSKSNNLEIAKLVVNIKAELEKIREQLQNIE
jgi:uncharacterized protein (TIGR00255 family)